MSSVNYETIVFQMLATASMLLTGEVDELFPGAKDSRGGKSLIHLHDEFRALIINGTDFQTAFEKVYDEEIINHYIKLNIAHDNPSVGTLGDLAMYVIAEKGKDHE